jgi:hypothetical protein
VEETVALVDLLVDQMAQLILAVAAVVVELLALRLAQAAPAALALSSYAT